MAAMETTRLGRTGLRVSRLCLGTMNFGPEASEQDSHRIMDRALDAGIFFFDTADMYGYKFGQWDTLPREGPTEQIIGRWLAQGGGRRERDRPRDQGLRPDVGGAERARASRRTTSAAPARRACGGCGPTTSTSTRCTTSTGTRPGTRSGRRWSCSCSRARCSTSARATSPAGTSRRRTRRRRGADSSASSRSRASTTSPRGRSSSRSSRPAARTASAILPWSPLGGGLLGGALEKAAGGPSRDAPDAAADRAAPRRSSSGTSGSAPSSGSAPRTSRSRGCSSAPASRRRSSGRARWSSSTRRIRAAELKLDARTLEAIDEIWPGPGGEAPEAYAW